MANHLQSSESLVYIYELDYRTLEMDSSPTRRMTAALFSPFDLNLIREPSVLQNASGIFGK